jgi:hypothetical protein
MLTASQFESQEIYSSTENQTHNSGIPAASNNPQTFHLHNAASLSFNDVGF